MGESVRLRLSDVRTVFRLVGECRELGDDPIAWRRHLVDGVMRLTGARVGMCGEILLAHADYTNPQVALGWEDNQATIWYDYLSEHVGKDDLFWHRVESDAALLQTIRRCDYVADHEWYQLACVHESWRSADVDRLILSGRMCRANEPTLDGLVLLRAWGEKRFSERECRLIQLLHDELAPLIGRQLAAAHELGPRDLSPRKREVLECLLQGDADKCIALRLGISTATVSEYVTDVFRHFNVSSRAQLSATFLRRFRRTRYPPKDVPDASNPLA
jgi:DNA-binding CsgD family transcriptional regulator